MSVVVNECLASYLILSLCSGTHIRIYSVFLRKVLGSGSSPAKQEPLVKKIAELYGAILFGEEKLEHANDVVKAKDEEVACIERELNSIQTSVLKEEESKRKILLRYIRAVKASVSLGEPGKGWGSMQLARRQPNQQPYVLQGAKQTAARWEASGPEGSTCRSLTWATRRSTPSLQCYAVT